MKIEEGEFYKTYDGRKAKASDYKSPTIRIEIEGEGFGRYVFADTGRGNAIGPDLPTDLVSLWQDEIPSPIQSKTVTYVKEGRYGRVHVHGTYNRCANLSFATSKGALSGAYAFTASELRAAALTFIQLAEFLEEGD